MKSSLSFFSILLVFFINLSVSLQAMDAVKALDESTSNASTAAQLSPLFLALDQKNFQMAQELVDKGADVNQKADGWYPLIFFAGEPGHVKTIKFLLKNGAHVNFTDEDGLSALYWAATNGREDAIKILLAAGALIDQRADYGVTPLMRAAESGKLLAYIYFCEQVRNGN